MSLQSLPHWAKRAAVWVLPVYVALSLLRAQTYPRGPFYSYRGGIVSMTMTFEFFGWPCVYRAASIEWAVKPPVRVSSKMRGAAVAANVIALGTVAAGVFLAVQRFSTCRLQYSLARLGLLLAVICALSAIVAAERRLPMHAFDSHCEAEGNSPLHYAPFWYPVLIGFPEWARGGVLLGIGCILFELSVVVVALSLRPSVRAVGCAAVLFVALSCLAKGLSIDLLLSHLVGRQNDPYGFRMVWLPCLVRSLLVLIPTTVAGITVYKWLVDDTTTYSLKTVLVGVTWFALGAAIAVAGAVAPYQDHQALAFVFALYMIGLTAVLCWAALRQGN